MKNACNFHVHFLAVIFVFTATRLMPTHGSGRCENTFKYTSKHSAVLVSTKQLSLSNTLLTA